jgi:hypothetical protein
MLATTVSLQPLTLICDCRNDVPPKGRLNILKLFKRTLRSHAVVIESIYTISLSDWTPLHKRWQALMIEPFLSSAGKETATSSGSISR